MDAAGERRGGGPSRRPSTGGRENGEWVAVALYPDDAFERADLGRRARRLALLGAVRRRSPPAAGSRAPRIPWDDVTLDQGTGIVHIAPGCGGEDFELSRVHDLAVLTPVDEAGRFYDDYGWLHGLSTIEAADQIVGNLGERGLLVEAATYAHAYPHCWRCDTPLIFRIADDWLISVNELRPQLLDANATVAWTPEYMGKRMDDWLRNMGDWNISRRRYYGLPLPFYPCACGHLNVIGSRAELEERAIAGLDQLEELRRPWIDRVPIRCEACGEAVERIAEVGDVWLDAGIVPFSTLGWQNRSGSTRGYATGAAKGPDDRRPSRPRLLGEVVPGRLGLGDARADPALVLLPALHVGRPRRAVAVQERARLREDARRAGPRDARLVGEHDPGRGRLRADGRRRDALAVLRPAARPEPPVRFRPGRRDQTRAADALELGVVLRLVRERRRVHTDMVVASSRKAISSPSTTGSSSALTRSSGTRKPGTRRPSPSRSCVRTRRTSTISPTGTSAVRDGASGTRTRRRSRPLVRARAVAPRNRAHPPVHHRLPLAEPRPRRAGVGSPCPLARGRRAGPRPARRDRGSAPSRHARPSGAGDERAEAAPTAAPAGRRGRERRQPARGRDRRRGACEGGAVRAGRGRAACQAQPACARAATRQGASRRAAGAPGG